MKNKTKQDLAREGDLFYLGFLDGEQLLTTHCLSKKVKEDREYIKGYRCGVSEQAEYLLRIAKQRGLDSYQFEWLTKWKKGEWQKIVNF